ncbi:PLP-dependent aminotransferase family protein [Stutzerimonas stutzeri]|uniref:PLP-dependent aminotransferase family protein n=1 Tax=Stutzerimonas stutzeri TaxID=316 RepID=A0A2S4AML1_STUST|nr:PLP-dependent aminotransferase family protein [Stutzerimonas stutzeri]MCQ4262750.1 PLP-dependent aminotransferase family protein [Stutzerimonas stutzeri]POH82731.1 PLP-dependent aminotransferase family protein [Stutzerimonas stutzeri]
MWLPELIDNDQPSYLALVDAISKAIEQGALKPGDRLPPQRRLAWALGLNPSTTMQAYREAARRHLVGGEVGRGTYVLAGSREASLFLLKQPDAQPALLDLSTNLPVIDAEDHDLQRSLLALGVSTDLADLQGYASPAAMQRGRLAASQWLRGRGLEMPPGQLLLCAGAQQGVFAALLGLCEPGEPILVEALTSPGIKAAARQLRLPLHGVAMDGRGILPEDFDRLARATGARVAVLTPCLQNPTSVSMDRERREAIATLARRHDLLVIEDDVYGALGAEPPLASLLVERSVLVGSLSKTVAPGLRFGFIASAEPWLARIDPEAQATGWALSPLCLRLASEWIEDGTAARRLAWQRQQIERRWRMARKMLGPRVPEDPSPHLWLPARGHEVGLPGLARAASIECASADVFSVGPGAPDAIRLSLSAAPGLVALQRGLKALASELGTMRQANDPTAALSLSSMSRQDVSNE